jgi:hypothetical protein
MDLQKTLEKNFEHQETSGKKQEARNCGKRKAECLVVYSNS